MTTVESQTKSPAKVRVGARRQASARELTAEALGTGLLVAVIVGSGVMATELSPGNDGVALLSNALATGMILVVLITCLGPVSGAHFNPAVTFAFWLRGDVSGAKALAYCATQIAAGVGGAILAHLMFGLDALQVGSHARWGLSQWLGEGIATFALVFTILAAIAVRPGFVASGVGLVVTAGIWSTSSTCFANPAVTIARALTDTFTAIRPVDAAPFVMVEFAAAGLAAAFAGWLFAEITHPDRS